MKQQQRSPDGAKRGTSRTLLPLPVGKRPLVTSGSQGKEGKVVNVTRKVENRIRLGLCKGIRRAIILPHDTPTASIRTLGPQIKSHGLYRCATLSHYKEIKVGSHGREVRKFGRLGKAGKGSE